MAIYNHKDIESKWQKYWEIHKTYLTKESGDKKFYILDMFPYPSGEGLHVGHPKGYIATDVYSRMKRMQGYDVLHPMGFDAFGLPAEQYALKNKVNPNVSTVKNVARYKKQLQMLGLNYDWDKEINTTDPKFYKWTQWMWKQMYKKGLAYESYDPINWCPSCKTGLANEDLENGHCERCGSVVEKKPLRQWTIRITDYADRLLADLDKLDWEPHIKELQRNWIGKSEGSELVFRLALRSKATFKFEDSFIQQIVSGNKKVTRRLDGKGIKKEDVITLLQKDSNFLSYAKVISISEQPLKDLDIIYNAGTSYSSKQEQLEEYKKYYGDSITLGTVFSTIDFEVIDSSLTVFTTRADTIFGATFMAISTELAEKWIASGWEASDAVKKMIEEIKLDAKQQDFSFKEVLEKKGIDTGIKAINPATNEEIPVFIANYILNGYGTGAIMAVPAHDERDYEFAKKYSISVRHVIAKEMGTVLEDAKQVEGSVVVVYDEKKDLFLKLINLTSDEAWLVGGGREEGESFEETAKRELSEESGFSSNKKMIELGSPVFSYYYNNLKNSNRKSLGYSFLAIVEEAEQKEFKHESHEKYSTEWVSFDNLYASIEKTEGGVDHWLEILRRAKVIVDGLKKNQQIIFCSTNDGLLINSDIFNGLSSSEARKKITDAFGGKLVSQYKLRDWTFARQRYWGEPFPIVFDENHISYAVADKELPVILPMVDEYEPTGTGESPLANIKEWVEVCGYINNEGEFETLPEDDQRVKKFRRETNTMPQWAGSSWYYLRFIDPHNEERFVDEKKEMKWSPVDFYVGGAEHATRHLIYARFWHKFLFDLGLVHFDEPFTKLQTVGLIMAEDGRKMSKRWGNIVNPDDVVNEYGADTLRLYEMFMGPFDQSVAWSTKSMAGVKRFLERYCKLYEKISKDAKNSLTIEILLNQTIKKVGVDIEEFKFNTAISALMILLNALEKEKSVTKDCYEMVTKLIAPFAPHLGDEMWEMLGNTYSIHASSWPTYNESKLFSHTVTVAIQVLGKLRGTIEVDRDMDDESLKSIVRQGDIYKKYVDGQVPKKVIIVKNKVVNIVL